MKPEAQMTIGSENRLLRKKVDMPSDVANALLSEDNGNEDQLNQVVAQLKRISRQASIEYALNVGRVVVHNFYAGDINAWRERGPKHTSFRRLARHPDLPMSSVMLYRCVATYELCIRVKSLSHWDNVNVSHIRAVLNLPQDMQVKLLAEVNRDRWTVRQLEDRVSTLRHERKRPARGVSRRLTKGLLSTVKLLQKRVHAAPFDVDGLSVCEREVVKDALHEAQCVIAKALATLNDETNDQAEKPGLDSVRPRGKRGSHEVE